MRRAEFSRRIRRGEVQIDVSRRQNIRGKTAHSAAIRSLRLSFCGLIAQTISLIASTSSREDFGDHSERFGNRFSALSDCAACTTSLKTEICVRARTDVVVQIGGDPAAHLFEFGRRSRRAIAAISSARFVSVTSSITRITSSSSPASVLTG